MIFVYIETGDAPHFTKNISSQTVNEGKILVLECEVKGFPMPKISWYHDKRLIRESRNFKLINVDEIGLTQLTIFEIFKDDEGEIKCVAENKYGKVETKAKIDVIGNY